MRWRLKSPVSRLFTQAVIQAQIKENIKAPRHWPWWGEFTGDRWIPRTKGPVTRKMFPFDDVITKKFDSNCSSVTNLQKISTHSGHGLVPLCNMPLPKAMLIKNHGAIWRHEARPQWVQSSVNANHLRWNWLIDKSFRGSWRHGSKMRDKSTDS